MDFQSICEWNLTSQQWNEIFETDNVEQIQKIFHLMSNSQKMFSAQNCGIGEHKCFKILQFLMKIGSFDNALNSFFQSSLASWNSFELITMSIRNDSVDSQSMALQWAIRYERLEIVQYLIETCLLKVDLDEKLIFSADLGLISMVKYFVNRGANVNARNFNSETAIFVSSKHGYSEIVHFLVEHCSAQVNVANRDGETPLMNSIMKRNVELMKYLIDHGADLSTMNRFGETAFFRAVFKFNHKLEVLKYLIEKGANMNVQDLRGQSVLMYSIPMSVEVVKFLVDQGCDLSATNDEGDNALTIACFWKRLEVAKILCEKGMNINHQNRKGETPLYLSSDRNSLDLVKYLISRGADMKIESKKGYTPFDIARACRFNDIVDFLENQTV